MTQPVFDPLAVLAELAGLGPAAAMERLRAEGEPPAVLGRLSESVESLAMSDLGRALDAAPLLVLAADVLAHPLTQARTRRAMAHALAYANRFDDALMILGEAVEAAHRANDAIEGARVRMATLHALARKGRLAEAIKAGEAALAAFSDAGDDLLSARAEINLGVVHRMRDDPRRAMEHFDRALQLLVDQPMLSAQLQSNRAEALLDLHDFRGAEAAFRSALDGFERLGAERAAAIVEGNLADLTSRQGRMQEAIAYFEGARRRMKSGGSPGDIARMWVEQAEAMLAIGMSREACEAFQTAIPTLREHGMSQELARAHLGLARSTGERSGWDSARASIAEARALMAAMGNKTGLAKASMIEASIARAKGDCDTSRRLLNEAITLLDDRPADAAMARLHLADLLLNADDVPAINEHIERAMAVAEVLDLAPLRAELLHLRARAHARDGRLGSAMDDYAAAIDQTERLRGAFHAESLRSAFLGRRSSVYSDGVSLVLDRGGPESVGLAFEWIERAKARSLQDAMSTLPQGEARLSDPVEYALLEEIDHLRLDLTALYSRTGDVGHPSRGNASDRIASIRQREQALRVAEQRLVARSPRRIVARDPVSLADVRAALADTSVFVEYFEEGENLSAIVATAKDQRVVRHMAPTARVSELADRLVFQIDRAMIRGLPAGDAGQRLRRDAERTLRDLHGALFEPLGRGFDSADRALIVPCGPLHRVPFHALLGLDMQPEIARRLVVTAPSAGVAAALCERGPARGARPLVVGVSDESIPHAEAEARMIVEYVPNADLLLGSQARIADVLASMRSRSIIHFATHARSVPSNPSASGLRLADGWLTAWALGEVDLGGSHVVLSGCSTGRSQLAPGEELLGLARAFLGAGASSLILSLWALHDRAARDLVASMREIAYLQGTLTSDILFESLRHAQLEMFHQGAHPARWASFFAIGSL